LYHICPPAEGRLNPISITPVFGQLPYYMKVSGACHASGASLLGKDYKVATRRWLGEDENSSLRFEVLKSDHVYQESKLDSSVF